MNKLILIFFLFCANPWAFGQRETPQQYIERYKDLAIAEMKRSGVPASITIAQGILESESGNSDLVKRSNNHFGIKCKSNWTGPSVSHDDDEAGECFRAYDSAEGSFRDHSDFLKYSSRYAALFDLDPVDYKGWAYGLKKAGYATNPRYAQILIDYIEKYDLNTYTIEGLLRNVDYDEYRSAVVESMQPEKMRAPGEDSGSEFQVMRINRLKAIKATAGTSLLAIATRFHIRLARLVEWNELDADGILAKSQIIYLERKHLQGTEPYLIAAYDRTLYEISQDHGIMVSSLAAFNQRDRSELIKAGTQLALMPGKQAVKTVPVISERTTLHVVEPREGLYAISKKYGVTIDQIKAYNELAGDQLQIGQKLMIPR